MSVTEGVSATPLNSALKEGLRSLDRSQEVTFSRYRRYVLPVDGFVFWVKKSLLTNPSGALNSFMIGSVPVNSLQTVTSAGDEFTVQGSLHYSTNNVQESTQVFGKNDVTFTTATDIDDFNDIGESEIFVGTWDNIQWAFSQRGNYYSQAGLYHYTGESINPIMRSQIIDDLAQLKTVQVVNNSLPIWMGLTKYAPVYPAYRGSQNVRPPFMSVEITESLSLQQTPFMDKDGNRDQLCKDNVEVTCYGLDNNSVLDYIRYIVIEQALLPSSGFGICNTPISKALNIPQSELNATANAKKIIFEINYYQSRVLDIAQQLMQQAFVECLPKSINN